MKSFIHIFFAAMLLVLLVQVSAATPRVSPHGDIKLTCTECHNAESWTTHAQDFNHAASGFPLQGSHAGLQCRQCHTDLKFTQVASNCASCHTDVHQASLGQDCQRCHEPITWNNEIQMRTAHQAFRFALIGPHKNLECFACHKGNNPSQFAGTATECQNCHAADYRSVTDPSHTALGLSSNCIVCHPANRSSWRPSTFDHQTSAFPLTGTHLQTRCVQCHSGHTLETTPTVCLACHQQNYDQSTNPAHLTQGYPTTCEQCHSTSGWQPSSFDHQATQFALTGVHATTACNRCHINGQFTGTPMVCLSCHQSDYDNSTTPPHLAQGYSTSCDICHSTSGWIPTAFNHQNTNFPLTGIHTTTNCTQCHINGQFPETPMACFSCHENNYNSSTTPPHLTQGYPTACGTCHSTSGWRPSSFNHQNTNFPLTGVHTTTNCTQCHVNGQFPGTPTACFSCHEDNYNGSTTPPHLAQGYPTTCNTCHSTSGWIPSSFNHQNTNFPLTGVHTTTNCTQCHINGQFPGTPTACFSCHEDNYNGSTTPPHLAQGYPTTCATCHSTSGWRPSTFDHQNTNFPLTGVHTTTNCLLCHVNGQFAGTPTACLSCHQTDYDNSTNPPHLAQGYPTTCNTCHSTAGWRPSTFDHQATNFPLTGAHISTTCLQCHINGQFAGTPTACDACHEQDYMNTTSPNHSQQGFPRTCQTCHTTAAWTPSSWNHNSTGFPLTGQHLNATCLQCHIGGVFPGTPTDCWSCHQNDFNAANDPNHVQEQFPHSCQDCHDTNGWQPWTFGHARPEAFPIYTGTHLQGNEWNLCSDCHNIPANFQHFECILCHAHRQSEMDNEHQEVGGYQWVSTACYYCHPDGRAEGLIRRRATPVREEK